MTISQLVVNDNIKNGKKYAFILKSKKGVIVKDNIGNDDRGIRKQINFRNKNIDFKTWKKMHLKSSMPIYQDSSKVDLPQFEDCELHLLEAL